MENTNVDFRTETYHPNGLITMTGSVDNYGFDLKLFKEDHIIDIVIVDMLGKPYRNQESFDSLKDEILLAYRINNLNQ